MSTEKTGVGAIELFNEYERDIWIEHNFDSLSEYVTEDVVYQDPTLSEPTVGADEFEQYLRNLKEGFSEFTFDTERVISDGEDIMWEWTFIGVHDGKFNGLPPTYRELEFGGMSRLSIANEKIKKDIVYFDQKELQDQLGLNFPTICKQVPKLAWRKLKGT